MLAQGPGPGGGAAEGSRLSGLSPSQKVDFRDLSRSVTVRVYPIWTVTYSQPSLSRACIRYSGRLSGIPDICPEYQTFSENSMRKPEFLSVENVRVGIANLGTY